jgi:hypothetical protein
MTVVSSLVASDLDPARLKSRGSVMLRDFLAYAADGTLASTGDTAAASAAGAAPSAGAPDPLLAEFARRLRGTGLVVHESFGAAGHPIDLAVEDPDHQGRVLVAVESDGPAYAAMRSTRDRDRLRGEQLGRLGWQHVRVWSTDLFRDPARDVSRVHTAIARAVAKQAPAGATEDAASAPEGPSSRSAQGVQGDLMEDLMAPAPDGAGTATEEEFVPTSDEGARQRRVRGRKAKRAPEQTKDDTDAGWGERTEMSAHDRWLQEQRPPHWGTD